MTSRIDPASVITKHLLNKPATVEKRRTVLHSKGKVSQGKLAKLQRPVPGGNKHDAKLPAAVKPTATSIRKSNSKTAQDNPPKEDWEIQLNASEEEALANLREGRAKNQPTAKLSETTPPEEEASFNGTTVLHEPDAPTATTVIKDQIAVAPDFAKLKLAEESAQEYLKKQAQLDLPPVDSKWHAQLQPKNPGDMFAMITEKRPDGSRGRGVTPFAAYAKEHPSALESPVGAAIAQVGAKAWHEVSRDKDRDAARKKSGQVLLRKAKKRNLGVSGQTNDKASVEAAPAAKRGKTSRKAPVPKEPPPTYEESRLRALYGPPPSYADATSDQSMAKAQERNALKRKPEQNGEVIFQKERKLIRSDRLENRPKVQAALERRITAAASKPKKD